jgi:hypothetical protein
LSLTKAVLGDSWNSVLLGSMSEGLLALLEICASLKVCAQLSDRLPDSALDNLLKRLARITSRPA